MNAVRWWKRVGIMAGVLLVLLAVAQGASDVMIMQITEPEAPLTEQAYSLKVTMTNTSSRDLTLVKSNPGCDFIASVKAADGHVVGFTEAGRDLAECKHRLLLGRRIIVTLHPGETTQDTYPLTGYYDLSLAGSYKVKLQREMPQSAGGGIISSNEVTLVVVR